MMLHIDGSPNQWFRTRGWHDLIVVFDDATSEVYCAQLIELESTLTVMAALKHVVAAKGVFCTLDSDHCSPENLKVDTPQCAAATAGYETKNRTFPFLPRADVLAGCEQRTG